MAKSEFAEAADLGEESKLVYSYFGLAIYWAQCLEQTFENMLIVGTFEREDSISPEFVESFYEELSKSKDTMGRMFKRVKALYSMSDDHTNQLFEILTLRNSLAHKFFKNNSYKWYTAEGKLEMILECVRFVQKTVDTDEKLKVYYFGYLEKNGITDEVLRAALEEKKREEIRKRKGS